VKLSRDGTEGTLDIDDGFELIPLSSSGNSRTVEVNAPYYFGGMPADVANNAAHNLQVSLIHRMFFHYAFRPRRITTCVDVAYSYSRSSIVCQSVSLMICLRS